MTARLLRLPEVISRVGLKRSTLYEMIARGEFPKQIKLGPRASAWPEQSVESWILQRITAPGVWNGCRRACEEDQS